MSHDFIKSSFNDPKCRSKTPTKISRWIDITMNIIISQSKDFFARSGIEIPSSAKSNSKILLNNVNSEALVIVQLFLWSCLSISCAQAISDLFCEKATATQQKSTSIQEAYLWMNCFVINVQISVKHCAGLLSPVIQKHDPENLNPSTIIDFTHACFTGHTVLSTSRVFSTFGIKPYGISYFNESNVGVILKAIGHINIQKLRHNMYLVMTVAFQSYLRTNPFSGDIGQFPDTFSKLAELELTDTDCDRTFNIMWFLYHFREVNDFIQGISQKDTCESLGEETVKSEGTPIIENKKCKAKRHSSDNDKSYQDKEAQSYHFRKENDLAEGIPQKKKGRSQGKETVKSSTIPIIKNKKFKVKKNSSNNDKSSQDKEDQSLNGGDAVGTTSGYSRSKVIESNSQVTTQDENTNHVNSSLHKTDNQLNKVVRSRSNKKRNLSQQPKGPSKTLKGMIPTLTKLDIIKDFPHLNGQSEKVIKSHAKKIFTMENYKKNTDLWSQLYAFSKCVGHLLMLAKKEAPPTKEECVLIHRTHLALDYEQNTPFGKPIYDKIFDNLVGENGLLENQEFVTGLVLAGSEDAIYPLLEMYLKPKEEGQHGEKSNQGESNSGKRKLNIKVTPRMTRIKGKKT